MISRILGRHIHKEVSKQCFTIMQYLQYLLTKGKKEEIFDSNDSDEKVCVFFCC